MEERERETGFLTDWVLSEDQYRTQIFLQIQNMSIKINKNHNYRKGKITGVIYFAFGAGSNVDILF